MAWISRVSRVGPERVSRLAGELFCYSRLRLELGIGLQDRWHETTDENSRDSVKADVEFLGTSYDLEGWLQDLRDRNVDPFLSNDGRR